MMVGNLCQTLMNLNEFNLALKYILDFSVTSIKNLNRLGICYMQIKDFDKSELAFE